MKNLAYVQTLSILDNAIGNYLRKLPVVLQYHINMFNNTFLTVLWQYPVLGWRELIVLCGFVMLGAPKGSTNSAFGSKLFCG